jgi:cytochrome c peroxidase
MKKISTLLIYIIILFWTIASFGGNKLTLTPEEELGKQLFFDKLSDPDWMSCATCHAPDVGFTGPIAGINAHGAVYRGAVPQRFGNRKPPSAAYATLSPIFHYDNSGTEGLFIGGNFWDGRATGEVLGNPAADQAQGPFLNPVEQNNASKQAVLRQIEDSKYADLWEEVWEEPISYDTPEHIAMNYDRVGLSIAAYEGSPEVNQFSSKYDYYLQGLVELTPEEAWGLELFNDEDEGNCAACHPSTSDNGDSALFTDFSFDNLGTPKNPENPFYDMDEVFLDDGTPINPLGSAWVDSGLGIFLKTRPEYAAMAAENMGKHKVPTLRNVGKSPGNNFPKAFLHNGVFKSLKEVVHFYNTRDVATWPAPEVAVNVNTIELGDLGLTNEEEDAIVAFMETLSDGYKLKKIKEKEMISEQKESIKVAGANPFNPTTKLAYTINEDSDIKIDIYNIKGQFIETLEKSFKSSGNYEITWNAQHLSSGVYIVVLKTNSQSIVQRVVLLK